MNNDQIMISNIAAELLRAMMTNPSVNVCDTTLPTLAVEQASRLHGRLLTLFDMPQPTFFQPSIVGDN